MKVSELIEILKSFPKDSLVVADGYEDGYDSIKKVKVIKVKEVEVKEWYYGNYDWSTSPDGIEVVYLDAESKNDIK
jgi:hypothetical protein